MVGGQLRRAAHQISASRATLSAPTRGVITPFVKILTDNGSQFADRYTSKDKRATGEHVLMSGSPRWV